MFEGTLLDSNDPFVSMLTLSVAMDASTSSASRHLPPLPHVPMAEVQTIAFCLTPRARMAASRSMAACHLSVGQQLCLQGGGPSEDVCKLSSAIPPTVCGHHSDSRHGLNCEPNLRASLRLELQRPVSRPTPG